MFLTKWRFYMYHTTQIIVNITNFFSFSSPYICAWIKQHAYYQFFLLDYLIQVDRFQYHRHHPHHRKKSYCLVSNDKWTVYNKIYVSHYCALIVYKRWYCTYFHLTVYIHYFLHKSLLKWYRIICISKTIMMSKV